MRGGGANTHQGGSVGKKISRQRVATLEELGEAEVFRLYIEHGTVGKVMGQLFEPATPGAKDWGRSDFYAWLRKEPGRWERWMEAKQDRGHVEFDLVSELADEVDSENAGAMRVKISARQWRAERLSRADYGSAPTQVNVGVGVQIGESWLAALRVAELKPTEG